MRIEQLLSDQLWFDTTRHGVDGSLWEKQNTPKELADRLIIEVQEYVDEPDPKKRILEAIDIMIFAAKMIVHDAVREGQSFDSIASMVGGKMARNLEKYHSDLFAGKTVLEALGYARSIWDEEAYQEKIRPLDNKDE